MSSQFNSVQNPSKSISKKLFPKVAASKGKSESGSETDASGSTETLSPEEKHTLKHTQRQDPQGQEQIPLHSTSIIIPSVSLSSSSSLLTSLAIPEKESLKCTVSRTNDCNLSFGSSTNTLIIHHSVPDDSWSSRWLAGSTDGTRAPRNSSMESSRKPLISSPAIFATRIGSKPSDTLSNIGIPRAPVESNISLSSIVDYSATAKSSAATRMYPGNVPKLFNSCDVTDIPPYYLDQSEVLKHLVNKECKDPSSTFIGSYNNYMTGSLTSSDQSASSSSSVLWPYDSGSISSCNTQRDEADILTILQNLPPPPSYDNCGFYNTKQSTVDHKISDKNLSKSQPDLSHICALNDASPSYEMPRILSGSKIQDNDNIAVLKEMLDILHRENSGLKLEVDIYHRKVAKLQKFEIEMAKVEEQHEALVKLCERREALERLARHKLSNEVRRLTDLNRDFKEQIDLLNNQLTSQSLAADTNFDAASLKRHLAKREFLIAQLVSQNRELIAAKERQQIELTAQRHTLNEQRTHIDILDAALTNAQTNVVKLEEEIHQKQTVIDQAEHLKRLLLSMRHPLIPTTTTTNQREQQHRTLTQKVEMEPHSNELTELQYKLQEKDKKGMLLEAEITKWEHHYLQDSMKKEGSLDKAPEDIKLSVMEKTSPNLEQKSFISNTSQGEITSLNRRAVDAEIRENNSFLLGSSTNVGVMRSQGTNDPPSFPTPRKDEELGLHGSRYSSLPQYHSSYDVLSKDHNKSGSYCCYVNPNDATEKKIANYFEQNVIANQQSHQFALEDQQKLSPYHSGRGLSHVYSASSQHNPIYASPASVGSFPIHSSHYLSHVGSNLDNSAAGILSGNILEIPTARGNPPPYYSQHQVYAEDGHFTVKCQSNLMRQNMASGCVQRVTACTPDNCSNANFQLPKTVTMCQRPHPPNAFCRTCLNVRRSHRQNAAALVRRANSSGGQPNRRSVPSPASSCDSIPDAPSILERLKKEWETGILAGSLKSEDGEGETNSVVKQDMGSLLSEAKSGDNQCERTCDYLSLQVEDHKRGVADLDEALNRLSIKINSTNQKYSAKSCGDDGAPSGSADSTYLLSAQANIASDCDGSASSGGRSPTDKNDAYSFNTSNDGHLLILEDMDQS